MMLAHRFMSRILIVDDDHEVLQTLALVLEVEGHECILAHSSTEALQLHNQSKPDLIVLDHLMPGMSGSELYHALRSLGDRTPILMLSADQELGYKVHLQRDPSGVLMKKPFDIDELLKVVQRLASQSAQQAS